MLIEIIAVSDYFLTGIILYAATTYNWTPNNIP